MVGDEELLKVVETEIRELLSDNGFSGDNVPVVRGSALGALDGKPEWEAEIIELASE